MTSGDPWEDEGFAGEDDWGEESIAADLEEDQPLEDADDDAEPEDEGDDHGAP